MGAFRALADSSTLVRAVESNTGGLWFESNPVVGGNFVQQNFLYFEKTKNKMPKTFYNYIYRAIVFKYLGSNPAMT